MFVNIFFIHVLIFLISGDARLYMYVTIVVKKKSQ